LHIIDIIDIHFNLGGGSGVLENTAYPSSHSQLPEIKIEKNLKEVKKRILRGFLDVVIACLLAEKPSWGYEIISEIHNKFHILLSPGIIYSVLYSMEKEGYIKAYEECRRRFYEITDRGREWLNQMINACRTVSAMVEEYLFREAEKYNEKVIINHLEKPLLTLKH